MLISIVSQPKKSCFVVVGVKVVVNVVVRFVFVVVVIVTLSLAFDVVVVDFVVVKPTFKV